MKNHHGGFMDFKRLASLLFLSLLALIPSRAQQAPTALPVNKEVPYYFPTGVQTTVDPILQRQEYIRYLDATMHCNQGNSSDFQTTMPEPGSVSVVTDVVSTSSVTENPAKMRIVLDHVIKMPDGSYRGTDLCHQFTVTEEQVKFAEADLVAVVKAASQEDYDFYKEIYGLAIEARAKKLGIPVKELTAELDESMPDRKGVSFREFNSLPKPSKASDFVPRELHLGFNIPLAGILGVTWLNTGVIYYNPDARIVDFLTGKPKVMAHEMVHCNINIEKFPMAEAFDAENLASVPEGLWAENELDLPSHSYFADVRELDEIYFNFDFAQMNKDIFKTDMAGNAVIDEKAYRFYYKQLDDVKKENLDFFRQVTIPEYYSDPVWWAAVNNIRGDKNSVFRMTMALHYNPTLLGGSKPTLEWLESNRELILQTAQSAFADAIKPSTRSGGSDDDMSEVPSYLVEQYNKMFTASERAHIQAYYTQNPDKLKALLKMKPQDAIQVLQTFKSNAAQKVIVQ